jgi:2-enoate reductase
MKAAEFAAARGFRVILFEKERELGGILRYADFDRFKTTLKRYKDNVAKRIAKMGVDIRLGHAVTPEEVKAEHADAVIVATGGKPAQLKCPCKAGANVLDATTAYLHPEKVGQKVVVVGGGLTGCEAAIHWGDQGRKVTLLSRSPQILKNFGPPNGTPFDSVETYLLMFENTGVELYEGYACVSVTEKGVTARGAAGEVFIPADTVINCAGMVPVPDAAAPFEGTAPVVKPVGDCVVPTVIGAATYGAYQAVMLL